MFDRGEDTFGLDAPHVPGGQTPRQERVLGVALEIAAGQRRPVQIDRRGEQPPAASVTRFSTNQGAERLNEGRVPRRAERGATGDTGGGSATHSRQRIP